MIVKQWLVLPCKVPGQDVEPLSINDVRMKFLRPGGISAYWRDITHNNLLIHFTVINEWLSPQFDISGYPGSGNGMRDPFYQACIAAAKAKAHPVDNYPDGVLVLMNAPFDLWGIDGQVMSDVISDHNDIAHEVGHGLGLPHTFGSPSPALLTPDLSVLGRSPYAFSPDRYLAIEYGDRGDIMSVNSTWSRSDGTGPAACGPMLLRIGALPEHRVWWAPWEQRRITATVSPLTDYFSPHPVLVGVRVDHAGQRYDYFVELRLKAIWDGGFPESGLLVHERRPDNGMITRLYHSNSDPDASPGLVLSKAAQASGIESAPLKKGEELVDPTRRIRLKAVDVDPSARVATVEIEIGSDPRPFEQRFRAVNAWASERGFVGAFPNFHEAEYGPGWNYPAILLRPEAVEWRDVLAAELGHPTTFEQRMRATNDWAVERGFESGFPNFHQADHGLGTVYGTILLKRGFAKWTDIPATTLGRPKTPEQRFLAVHKWAVANGYIGAFPNFHEAERGLVYGTILLTRGMADWQDVPAHELGSPATFEQRFTAINDWAHQRGYIGAFPTFFQGHSAEGTVHGATLIRREAADWLDIPVVELGDVTTPEARFRAVNDWAVKKGYLSGFPNFHEADYGKGKVYGAILIKRAAGEWRDVPAGVQGDPLAPDERFRRAHLYAIANDYGGAFPNFHEADYGRVYGTILIPRHAGTQHAFQAAELSHPATREARFRAVNDHAGAQGHFSGFPTFDDTDKGRGTVFGTISLRSDAADWRDISRGELGYATTSEGLFRGANDWAVRNGYAGAFPNFFEADHGHGRVYGTVLIKREASQWQDIPAADLGFPQTPEARFRTVNDWAVNRGYVSGFPNFHEATYDVGLVYGAVLIKQGFAVWQDVGLSQLVFR